MDIRIDSISDGSKTVVHVAGRLSGRAVAVLKKVCNPVEDPLVFDLSNLLFADDEGVKVIRAFVEQGAQVHRASPFVKLLLESSPNGKTAICPYILRRS